MTVLGFGPLAYTVEGPLPPELEVFEKSSAGPDAPLVDVGALSDRVIHDAPTVGAVVLHAAGILVGDGVVALVAPPGTGKTTAAVNAGARGLAYNAMLMQTVAQQANPWAWALPFAGGDDPHPPIRDTARFELRAILRLVRSEWPKFEWVKGSEATTVVLSACVWPRDGGSSARERAVITLDIASRVRVGRIAVPLSSAWLETLDIGLKGS